MARGVRRGFFNLGRVLPIIGALSLAPFSLAASHEARPTDPAGVEDFTIAITGDAIGPYEPVMQTADARLARVAGLLNSADAAFGNQEGSIFDLSTFPGTLGAENGGGKPLGSAAVARDLKRMGLTMMSKANNHAVDWGLEGLAATERSLDAAGIVHAGSGDSEAAARAPAYLATAHGRVGLVATASTYPDMARAGPPVEEDGVKLRGRAGVSTLGLREVILVTPAEMQSLQSIAARRTTSPGASQNAEREKTADLRVSDFHSGEQTYRVGGPQTLRFSMDQNDLAAILGSLTQARGAADRVVFSIHAHETASGAAEDPAPADFLPPLFHQAIDAGADVVVRTGPHALKGVEIYKGKPIFYGMGSFYLGIGGPDRMFRGSRLPPAWDESVIALAHFHGGQLVDVRLYPTQTIREAGPLLGAPMLAPPADAERILRRLQAQSEPYGTKILIRDGVGVIEGR